MNDHAHRLGELAKSIFAFLFAEFFLDVLANIVGNVLPVTWDRVAKAILLVVPIIVIWVWTELKGSKMEKAGARVVALLGGVATITVYLLNPPFQGSVSWTQMCLIAVFAGIGSWICTQLRGDFLFFRPFILFALVMLVILSRFEPPGSPGEPSSPCPTSNASQLCASPTPPSVPPLISTPPPPPTSTLPSPTLTPPITPPPTIEPTALPRCPNVNQTILRGEMYMVQPGDTLSCIAVRADVLLDDLKVANPQIADPKLIHPGDQIWIP